MAEVELRIPKELDLSKEEIEKLQESFQKQLADTLHGSKAAGKLKPGQSRVEIRAKVKNGMTLGD